MTKYWAKLIKLAIWLIPVIALGILILFLSPRRNKQSLRIDQTAIIIQEINRVAQLFTARYYDELVLDTFKLQPRGNIQRFWSNFSSPAPFSGRVQDDFQRVDLVVIARGTVMAGYDFGLMEPADMIIEGKSIVFTLPPPQILEVIINPSDYEVFIEEGRWSLEESVALKQKAGRLMVERAVERGIFTRSESTARAILTRLFLSLGFDQIEIRTSPDDVSESLRHVPLPG